VGIGVAAGGGGWWRNVGGVVGMVTTVGVTEEVKGVAADGIAIVTLSVTSAESSGIFNGVHFLCRNLRM
jgi:hypothetical protein